MKKKILIAISTLIIIAAMVCGCSKNTKIEIVETTTIPTTIIQTTSTDLEWYYLLLLIPAIEALKNIAACHYKNISQKRQHICHRNIRLFLRS